MSSRNNGMTAWICHRGQKEMAVVWESFHWKTQDRSAKIGNTKRAFGPLRVRKLTMFDWRRGGAWVWALWFVNGRRKLDFRFRFEERKHCPLSWWCNSAVVLEVVYPKPRKRNTGTRKWRFGSDESLFDLGVIFNQTVCFRGSRQQPGAIFEQFACHGPVLHRLKTSATLSFVEHFSLF